MIVHFVFVLLFLLIHNSLTSAFDFDDCASAARNLKNAAEEAVYAQQGYEFAKSNYESACSSYGYDRDNSSACGRYGYHRSTLDMAKSELDSKASEVADYASRVNSRCDLHHRHW
ncbi:MAG: hypothetical protein JW384_01007 [Nitrosomonadaceae bacterium]|nr:hypothetical protein [Nitrosomonadaceae bacterium]